MRVVLDRCWGDRENAARVIKIFETQVLPLNPEFTFTRHAAYADATEVWRRILEASREALRGETEKGR